MKKRVYAAPAESAKKTRTTSAPAKTLAKTSNLTKKGSTFQKVAWTPSLGPLGFPKKLKATLRYVETVTISLSATDEARYLFSCNGLYDPNITGTGHQPMYFDQLMAIYDHYTVIGSKITAVLLNAGPAGGANIYLGVDDDASVNAGFLMERSMYVSTATNDQSGPKTLNNNWSASKTFGGSILGNDNLQGTVATNPTEVSNYVISVRTPGVVTDESFNFQVTIDYTTIFDELQSISGS